MNKKKNWDKEYKMFSFKSHLIVKQHKWGVGRDWELNKKMNRRNETVTINYFNYFKGEWIILLKLISKDIHCL